MTRANQGSGRDDKIYLIGLGRTQGPDFTPYSAVSIQSTVSSFNLPVQYDSSLITPVSMTSSPPLATKPIPSMRREPDIKLSPNSLSPNYPVFDDDYEMKYNPPMKYKESSGALQISAADSFFPPGSPFVCSSPYYGNFGVSATPKTSNSSPSFHQSPNMQSAGGYSTGSYHSRHQTPSLIQSASTYRANVQTPIHIAPSPSSPPILIAPNPGILKPATTRNDGGPRRQNSFQSNQSSPRGRGLPQGDFSREGSSSSSKGKRSLKRKNSPEDYEQIAACSDMTDQERLLLELAIRDDLPWKEVMAKYNAAFPQKQMKTAALQMKKKRLVDRLRTWTDEEVRKERALMLSYDEHDKGKWSAITKGMHKHGGREKWSTEAAERKFNELQGSDYMSQFQTGHHRRTRTSSSDLTHLTMDQRSWSHEGDNVSQSLCDEESGTLISALSTATMDDMRSKAASDVSVQMQLEQHHEQQHEQRHRNTVRQQMLYDQQNHQNHQNHQHQQHQRQHLQQQQQQQNHDQQRHNSWTSGA